MTVLVVVAVEAERNAVLRGSSPDVEVAVSGVGPVAAATTTATALARQTYSRVISAGIAGGLAGRARVGDVVVAQASIAADLGSRTDSGFLSLSDMGLDQDDRIEYAGASAWRDRLLSHGVAAVSGDVLTLSCMTGTDADGTLLSERYPHAVAEAMEGWGVAWAARSAAVPSGEIRAVSNVVGRRDKDAWDLDSAFDALARAMAELFAEPLS